MTKETLLEKVQLAEKEAQDQLVAAEKAGQRKLEELRQSEAATLRDVRATAEEQAAIAHQELLQQTKAELNQVKQEEEVAVAAIATTAANNHKAARALSRSLFDQSITSS